MNIDLPTALEGAAGAVTALGGAYTTVRHLLNRSKIKKQEHRQDILKEAKEEADKIKISLETKIKALEVEFQTQKQNVSKDLAHFKETHGAEVKALGEKIESLRQDLSQQHQALIGLLTKLVDTK